MQRRDLMRGRDCNPRQSDFEGLAGLFSSWKLDPMSSLSEKHFIVLKSNENLSMDVETD